MCYSDVTPHFWSRKSDLKPSCLCITCNLQTSELRGRAPDVKVVSDSLHQAEVKATSRGSTGGSGGGNSSGAGGSTAARPDAAGATGCSPVVLPVAWMQSCVNQGKCASWEQWLPAPPATQGGTITQDDGAADDCAAAQSGDSDDDGDSWASAGDMSDYRDSEAGEEYSGLTYTEGQKVAYQQSNSHQRPNHLPRVWVDTHPARRRPGVGTFRVVTWNKLSTVALGEHLLACDPVRANVSKKHTLHCAAALSTCLLRFLPKAPVAVCRLLTSPIKRLTV